jgi:predicted dehydrogenase
LLLYDFAIHWFDIVMAILGPNHPRKVYAAACRNVYQTMKPPFLAHVVIECEHVQVRLGLNAHVQFGQEDRTVIAGGLGTLRSWGPGLNDQRVELWTSGGVARPALRGNWFDNGFEGTMGELLSSIEQDRIPWNNARDNLESLRLCFAALRSADSGQPVEL